MESSYDVLIIGAGVVGACIARELCRYHVRVAAVEKEVDVSFGTSKANSGIIHAGFHAPPGTLKARLEVKADFKAKRKRFYRIRELIEQRDYDKVREITLENRDYSNLVCRCENITEAETCGENAARYLRGEAIAGREIRVKCGNLVRYVLPAKVRSKGRAQLSLRAIAPAENVTLMVESGGELIYRKKYKRVLPSEMARLLIKDIPAGANEIKVWFNPEER